MIRINSVRIVTPGLNWETTSWSSLTFLESWMHIYHNFLDWRFSQSGFVTVNQSIRIEVDAEDISWGNIKREIKDWEYISNFRNWQELKDFN